MLAKILTPIQRDLIFDVGLHKGEDSEYYLKMGFRVIGVEADPDLVRECHTRFAKEVASGQLKIIQGAIAEGRGRISLYKNENSVWGTTSQQWAKRNERLGSQSKLINVDVVDVKELFQTIGLPFYLKL